MIVKCTHVKIQGRSCDKERMNSGIQEVCNSTIRRENKRLRCWCHTMWYKELEDGCLGPWEMKEVTKVAMPDDD